MIIPFFIPHAGCPHQCVFCNQKNITGRQQPVPPGSVPGVVDRYIGTRSTQEPVQVAFYGGSFTALSKELQKNYLEAIRPFIRSGRVQSIRLSTRPDCISPETLSFLEEYAVQTIELGAQSMDDLVLGRSGRGHIAADTIKSVRLIRESGMKIGLQLMPGLPGDSADLFYETVEIVIKLRPDFVRLYPVLVIKGTPLEILYGTGEYRPLSVDAAVSLCRSALERFEQESIEVIRIGLQPTEELERPGTIIAGPYHPAFRQLVESLRYLEKMRTALREEGLKNSTAFFYVHPSAISFAVGQKRSNLLVLKNEFSLRTIRILPDPGAKPGTVRFRPGEE